jgi:uroporphyrinogen decarboxylase
MHFLEVLKGNGSGPPPIWLMRQAGRYLPAYRILRAKRPFLELLRDPDMVAQVTLLPFQEFDLDAAVLFTDILAVLWGLGLEFQVEEGHGIRIPERILHAGQLNHLPAQQVYKPVLDGIRLLKQELKRPLIGVVGGPWTVTTYLLEGKSPGDALYTKGWLNRSPETVEAILNRVTEATCDFAVAQVEAGVDALQLFDTWASLLSPAQWRQLALPAVRRVCEAVGGRVPLIHFCRGTSSLARDLAQLPLQAISVDWQSDLSLVRQLVGPQMTLQGNLDPALLLGDQQRLALTVRELLQTMQGDRRYIFNLGHGVLPQTPVESIHTLIETIRRP